MAEEGDKSTTNALGKAVLVIATGAAILYGLFLVVGVFSASVGSGAAKLGIAVILFVQSAQLLHALSE